MIHQVGLTELIVEAPNSLVESGVVDDVAQFGIQILGYQPIYLQDLPHCLSQLGDRPIHLLEVVVVRLNHFTETSRHELLQLT